MEEKEQFIRIFVYGSLRKNMFNHYLIEKTESKFEKMSKINKIEMYEYSSFPMCIKSDNENNFIKVESYIMPLKSLPFFDYLEGHPNFYKREIVQDENGNRGIIYLGNKNLIRKYMKKVDSGDWVKYLSEARFYGNKEYQEI